MALSDPCHELWQVAFHMQAKRQKVRQNQDMVDAAGDELVGGVTKTGDAELTKSGNGPVATRRARQGAGYDADGIVGRFHAGAVGKNDDAGCQALPIYARMWCNSSDLRASS